MKTKKYGLLRIGFLNDTQEFDEGYELLKKYVFEFINSNKESLKLETNQCIDDVMQCIKDTIVFSASFSKNGDLLSQWRSYTPKDGGFSLGFAQDEMLRDISHDGAFLQFDNCIYDTAEQDRQAKLIGETYIQGFELHGVEKMNFRNCLLDYLHFIIRCKNSHFVDEDEVRMATFIHKELMDISIHQLQNIPAGDFRIGGPMMLYKNQEIKFRSKANLLIPYMVQTINIESIKQIVIGPSHQSELAEESLRFFLKAIGLDIEIVKSEIPFRNI